MKVEKIETKKKKNLMIIRFLNYSEVSLWEMTSRNILKQAKVNSRLNFPEQKICRQFQD